MQSFSFLGPKQKLLQRLISNFRNVQLLWRSRGSLETWEWFCEGGVLVRSGRSRGKVIADDDHGGRVEAKGLFWDRHVLREAVDAGRELASIRDLLASLALMTPHVTYSAHEARGKGGARQAGGQAGKDEFGVSGRLIEA